MKEYVNKYTFRNRFRSSDNYANQFSTKGLDALFEYIEEVEDDIGEEFEFDMVGICCDYTEYDDIEDFHNDYGAMKEEYGTSAQIYKTLDDIREQTTVIEIPDTERFIIGVF